MSARQTPGTPALPEGVVISFGTATDIGLLRTFWLELHHIHQEADPELAPHVDDQTSWRRRALYEHCLESPDAFLLLVRRDDSLLGYALVAVETDGDVLWSDTWQVGDKVAELETMYLVPEERGRGLGGLLLDTVEAELEARGIPDMAIGAVPGNTGALRFYERRGFRPTGTIVTRFAARRTAEAQARRPTPARRISTGMPVSPPRRPAGPPSRARDPP